MDALAPFLAWVSEQEHQREGDFQHYVHAIAQARYVIRKVIRTADDAARDAGLDPLAHQALIQVHGSEPEHLTISQLAARLDIVPAFASRLTKDLESRGLVSRMRGDQDRRVTRVTATTDGRDVLRAIDDEVHTRVVFFQRLLKPEERRDAMVIFAFMVGMSTGVDHWPAGASRA